MYVGLNLQMLQVFPRNRSVRDDQGPVLPACLIIGDVSLASKIGNFPINLIELI